ncbi:MAG: cupredoxin domain-containing protein [Chloroflexi bacterium]|nr:cupredoxin domain-containing protein [Chloroflexota bacterium]
MRLPRWVFPAVGIAALSTAVLAGTTYLVPSAGGGVKEFTLQASQFAYTPNIITVNKGDRVRLRVQPTDVSHGLYVDTYNVGVQASPGQEGVVEFVADRAGKFRFRCAETCGPFHPFMIGELEVQPNAPYGGALATAGLVGAGTMAFVWRKREESDG